MFRPASAHQHMEQTQLMLKMDSYYFISSNILNAELNPIFHLLALLGAHHILRVSRLRVKWKDLSLSLNILDLT